MDVVGANTIALPHAARVIDGLIAPLAEHIDDEGVPRSSLDALAAAGLLGDPLPPAEQRELGELISMADASTWFCWVQHQSPLRALQHAPQLLQQRWLGGLGTGTLLGAVAFAHLRRPGPANPSATRVAGGWRITGTLDWVTSWDIADVVAVMVEAVGADAGQIVTFALPAGRHPATIPGMTVGEPLRLLAMSGTHTRPVVLTDCIVGDDLVAGVEDLAQWRRADAVRTADASPAAFGVTRGAVAELAELAEQRHELGPIVDALAAECRAIRAQAYDLADRADETNIEARLKLRAAALDLVMRATNAVVIARAGAAMRSGCSAERRAREALFLQVQAQTASSRAAGLQTLVRDGR